MIVPIVYFFIGFGIVGVLYTILDPIVGMFFEYSTTSGPIMAFLGTVWQNILLIYMIGGVIALILIAQKRNSGGVFS